MALKMNQAPHPTRIVNKAGMAAFFGISLPTCDSWIRSGMPVVERGDSGRPWRVDLLAAAEWRFKPKTDAAAESGKLDPQHEKARLDAARADLAETQLGKVRGELIPAAEFEHALSEALKTTAMTLESLPDLLERDAGLPGAAVDRAIVVIDRLREDLYRRLTGIEA